MKKILFLAILAMAFAIQCFAEEKKEQKKEPESISMEFHSLKIPDKVHRAPMHIDIEAYYNADSNSIVVCGSASAEVNLYLDGCLIDHNDEINTSFMLPETSGTYMIEVLGGSWTATGYLCL